MTPDRFWSTFATVIVLLALLWIVVLPFAQWLLS